MSNETHDQNQSVDTPDTAPSRMRVLVLAIIAYLLVACLVWIFFYSVDVEFAEPVTPPVVGAAPTVTSIPEATSRSESALITPVGAYWAAPQPLLVNEQITAGGLVQGNTLEEIEALFGENATAEVLFIDPLVMAELGEEAQRFLQDRYTAGTMLVGLQSPHSQLTNALQLEPNREDIDLSTIRDDQIVASIHYTSASGPQELVQIFDEFNGLLALIDVLR